MQVTAKSIMLEQYNKLLKNDAAATLQSAKENASPLLIGKTSSETDSSTSVLDKVQISQAALDMLKKFLVRGCSNNGSTAGCTEKIFPARFKLFRN
ncbi:MAG: hypothetical protein LRY51_06765 [Geovibrio sp.]|nr:hypothetical protein [Geovibrio sp.]